MKKFIKDLNLSHFKKNDIDYFSEVPFKVDQKTLDLLREDGKYDRYVICCRQEIEKEALKKGFIEF